MQIEINQQKKEVKAHGKYEFPVNVSREMLSRYERGSFCWHWHPEIELTVVTEGEMEYRVNGDTYYLKKGEGLFGNSNTLHTGKMVGQLDCSYLSVTFHPRLVYGFENSLIQKKYVDGMLSGDCLSSLHLTDQISWQLDILNGIRKVQQLSEELPDGWEMEIQQQISAVWLALYRNWGCEQVPAQKPGERNLERLRTILSFIQEHYSERITLEEIAGTVNICESECCRFFKKHMKESLFRYLLRYRVEQSLPYLLDPDYSITQLSVICGFSSPCYYTKIFREQMSCTPTEYRRMQLERM